MKPYVVVRYSQEVYDFNYRPSPEFRNTAAGIAYTQKQDEDTQPHHARSSASVFFVDNEQEGWSLATVLAAKHPSSSYLVAKTSSVFSCPPGTVKRAIVNDKGVMPAA